MPKGSRLEQYQFELANTYWQFIFHGVADEQLGWISYYEDSNTYVQPEYSHSNLAKELYKWLPLGTHFPFPVNLHGRYSQDSPEAGRPI